MGDEFNTWLIAGGLAVGLAFGVVVQRSRFCMVSAVSNLVLIRDTWQLRAVIAAVGAALMGTQILESAGWVAVAEASYRARQINWIGAISSGLTFGFGAMLAGGCNIGNRLTRVSTCSLEAILAIAAIVTGMRLGPSWLQRAENAWLRVEKGKVEGTPPPASAASHRTDRSSAITGGSARRPESDKNC